MKLIDLTGARFGEWLVLGRAVDGTNPKSRWIVQCSCGSIKSVQGDNLRSGASSRCRLCANNSKVGKYIVEDRDDGTYYECSICRHMKIEGDFPAKGQPDKSLKRRVHTWCRACTKTRTRERRRANIEKHLHREAKRRALQFGIAFDITVEDIKVPNRCPILDTELEVGDKYHHPNSASIDRVDSTRGYVKGNIAVISFRANTLKNDGTAIEHEKIAEWMRRNKVE